jgi:hypothetical protein
MSSTHTNLITPYPEGDFANWLDPIWNSQEVEVIYIPLRMPTHNVAGNWSPFERKDAVSFIHEAVRISAENMFDRNEVPEEWEWLESPKADPIITRTWFLRRWVRLVLGRGNKKNLNATHKLRRDECTIVDLRTASDGRWVVHIHSRLQRLTDPDGVKLKWLVDGLIKCQFFPDDSAMYIYSVTQSQEKLPTDKEMLDSGKASRENLYWEV